MKKSFIVSFIIVVYCLATGICLADNKDNPQQDEMILTATENLFQYMKNREYAAIWKHISFETRKIIINDVQKAIKKSGKEINKEDLQKDFISGGTNAKEYWDGYLSVFNPDIALQQCEWKMGKIEKKEAEVILQYKKSEKPAVLKIYNENGAWQVGLEESFGARRLNPF